MEDYKKLFEDAKEISKMFGAENAAENKGSDMNISGLMQAMEIMKSMNSSNAEDTVNQERQKSFDDALIPQNVKMLKSVVPFLEGGQGRNMAVAVKAMELFYVMEKYGEGAEVTAAGYEGNERAKQLRMINALREHMDENGRRMADTFIKVMNITELMKNT
ncbi:MAG: hypothetical protein LBU94_02565 [Clostridiales bacterium]|jgi:hypothetical protein|nr:hypothetical protein [Clostridiales bacterium]